MVRETISLIVHSTVACFYIGAFMITLPFKRYRCLNTRIQAKLDKLLEVL